MPSSEDCWWPMCVVRNGGGIPGFRNDQHKGTSATIIHSRPVPTGTVLAGLPSPTPTEGGVPYEPTKLWGLWW